MDANSLYCFKLVFGLIKAAKYQAMPIERGYILPKIIEPGKLYNFYKPSRK